jgi:hypothetical protein
MELLIIIIPGIPRVLRSRLHKKVQRFTDEELPLLIKAGYLINNAGSITEFRNAATGGVTVFRNTAGVNSSSSNDNNNNNDNNDDIHAKHVINDNDKKARQKEIEVCELDADSNTCRRIYNPICLRTNYSRRATDVSAAS